LPADGSPIGHPRVWASSGTQSIISNSSLKCLRLAQSGRGRRMSKIPKMLYIRH
jgi:hypothetical protein